MTKKRAAYMKAYRAAHREERAAYMKAWDKAHRTERVAYKKAQRTAHRAAIAEREKVYRDAHKTERSVYNKAYRKSRREERAAYDKAWAKAHPDKMSDRKSKRRALKLGATIEKVSRAVVYERDDGRCHLCGKRVPKKGWHLDHIVPLARGGEHSYLNVAVSCAICNLRKHTRAGAQLRLN